MARIKLSYLHFCQEAVKERAWEIWHGDMVRFGFRDPYTHPKPTVAVVTRTMDYLLHCSTDVDWFIMLGQLFHNLASINTITQTWEE